MELKIKWQETDKLEELIRDCYFDSNCGVLKSGKNLLVSDPINFTILKGLSCDVKVKSNIIDGVLKCLKQEIDGQIYLKPTNIYCMRSDDNKKYSFY